MMAMVSTSYIWWRRRSLCVGISAHSFYVPFRHSLSSVCCARAYFCIQFAANGRANKTNETFYIYEFYISFRFLSFE